MPWLLGGPTMPFTKRGKESRPFFFLRFCKFSRLMPCPFSQILAIYKTFKYDMKLID